MKFKITPKHPTLALFEDVPPMKPFWARGYEGRLDMCYLKEVSGRCLFFCGPGVSCMTDVSFAPNETCILIDGTLEITFS